MSGRQRCRGPFNVPGTGCLRVGAVLLYCCSQAWQNLPAHLSVADRRCLLPSSPAALLLTSPAAALADSSSSGGGSGMTISFAPPSVKQALEARDEAMSYQ